MRITESALRKIIREEILNEVPITDMGDYTVPPDEGDSSTFKKSAAPSIGSAAIRLKSDRLKAKAMFLDTAHNWAIITLSDARFAEKTLKTPAFKQWLLNRKISSKTKILVVIGPSLSGDFKSARWAIGHDIFGHSLSIYAGRTTPKFSKQEFNSEGDSVDSYYDISEIIEGALWKVIPRELQLGNVDGDRLPDVMLAIFLGKLDRELAIAAAKAGIEEKIPAEDLGPKDDIAMWSETFVDHYFESVESWIKSIKPGVIKIINPFYTDVYPQDIPMSETIPNYDKELPF